MNSPRDIVNNLGYYSAVVHGYSMYPLLFAIYKKGVKESI